MTIQWILDIWNAFKAWNNGIAKNVNPGVLPPESTVNTPVVVPAQPVVTPTVPVVPKPTPSPVSPQLFDTPQNTRHSVRVLCDNAGLSVYNKNVITACIEQESAFKNLKDDGTPILRHNYSTKTGKLLSTDWGICQINDTPGWHIGPGLAFPSVDFVVGNPAAAVQYMIKMLKAGKINLWVSYSSSAYKKFMPQ